MSPTVEMNGRMKSPEMPEAEQIEMKEIAVRFAARIEEQEFANDSDLSASLVEQLADMLKKDKTKAEQEERVAIIVEKVLDSATISSLPSEKLIKSFEMMVTFPNLRLDAPKVMSIISRYTHFERYHCIAAITNFLRSYLPHIKCSDFSEMPACKEFVEELFNLIKWMLSGAQQAMKNYNVDPMGSSRIAIDLLNTAKIYLSEPFIFTTIQIVSQRKLFHPNISHPLSQLNNMNKMMAQSEEVQKVFEEIQKLNEAIPKPPEPLPVHFYSQIGKHQRRPGIRTLSSIFLAFRVLTPATEIAETIELLGTISGYKKTQVVHDILHASLLIMLEEFPMEDSQVESKVPLDVYKLNLCNIYFKKFPQVFEILIKREYLSFEDVLQSTEKMIRSFKYELDMLDSALKDNSIECFLNEFAKNHPGEAIDRVKQLRVEQIKHTELSNVITRAKGEVKQVPPTAAVGQKLQAVAIAKEKAHGFENCIKEIIYKDQLLFDSYLSWFTVEGDITNWTQRVATMLLNAEKKFTEEGKNTSGNLESFSLFFHILARVSWYYSCISLEDLVTGGDVEHKENLECGFYKWSKVNVMKIVKKEEEDPNAANESKLDSSTLDVTDFKGESEKEKKDETMEIDSKPAEPEPPKFTEEMRQKCIDLVHRTTFWDLETQSPFSLIELVPTIGEVWLAENKTKNVEVNTYRELFITLKEFPIMVLCLCQWLECQPQSPQRFSMGRGLLEVISEWHKSIPKSQTNFIPGKPMEPISWQFLWLQCKAHLIEITEFPPVYHQISFFQKSIANRVLPKCGRYQVPCVNMMKDGWIYCHRQNWFSVKAFRLLDHFNKSNNHRNWTNGFLYNSVKQETQDTAVKSIELMSAVLFLDPIRSVTKAIEVVTDLMLLREPTKSPNKPTKMQQPECTMSVIESLIQVLLIGVWLVNREREKESQEPAIKRRRSSIEVPDQPWKSLEDNENDIECLDQFITNSINCLQSEAFIGEMRPATAMIYHMLHLIARSPKTRYRDALIKRIPQHMIFRMAVVDPKALPLQVFAEFCEDNQSHSESLLQYHFLLRKCGGI